MANTNTYFDELINADENLSFFQEDLGLKLSSQNLEFKIDKTQQKLSSDRREMYSPQFETTLLAHLLYWIGYIRFKKPLKVKANIISGDSVQLAKGTRFTDGVDIYYLDDFALLEAEETREIFLTNAKHYTKEYVVEKAILYYKIPTKVTYKELHTVEVKRNGVPLKYSQNHIKYESDFSYEVKEDGLVWIAVLLGNKDGANIQLGDTLSVKVITTPDTIEVPSNLAIIENGYNIAIPLISKHESYISPMSILDMQDMVKYGRKNIGDIVVDEDYRQFIKLAVGGILEVKVWQEREETKEVGYKIENINKVFVSYIGTDDNTSLDSEVIDAIQTHIYGKPVTIKEAIIVPINVSVVIKTEEGIGSATFNKIKDSIKGYYDDFHKVLEQGKLYGVIFKIVSEDLNDFVIDVGISDKGLDKNRNFFHISESNIEINITQ